MVSKNDTITPSPRCLAIATDDVALYFNKDRFISMHGSLTEDEMLIPLIVF